MFIVLWETLLEKFKKHYSPVPSRIAMLHTFHQRSQREGESINDYMASLQTAALYCDFRKLNEMLLDPMFVGLGT